jgi:hypothetical protein
VLGAQCARVRETTSARLVAPSLRRIIRVEENSDAYHLKAGMTDVMVAYLLEVTRKGAESQDTR